MVVVVVVVVRGREEEDIGVLDGSRLDARSTVLGKA